MSQDKFVDYCPSIKPGDERYRTVQLLLKQSGCEDINQTLTDCLNEHRKNWAKCTVSFKLGRSKIWPWPNASKKVKANDNRI